MKARDGFIGLFLAFQLLIPLSYYLSDEPGYDDRFAWRMLSETHTIECTANFLRDKGPMPAAAALPDVWLRRIQQGWMPVTKAVLAHLCEQYPDSRITLEMQCQRLDGSTEVLADGQSDYCSQSL